MRATLPNYFMFFFFKKILFSMRRTLPLFCWMMNFGYVGYLLKILLKITMLAYIFKMICVMVIVETVLIFLNDVFEMLFCFFVE